MHDKQFLKSRMDVLWHPRRVAMVGATNSMMKWGFIILARMLNEGFEGEIYPVNPRDDVILGKKVYKSINDVPGPVDVAVVVTPAPVAPARSWRRLGKGKTEWEWLEFGDRRGSWERFRRALYCRLAVDGTRQRRLEFDAIWV